MYYSTATSLLLALAGLGSLSVACTTESSKITFYGEPDNSPPGCDTAYDCGNGFKAGGEGTFNNPLTFASSLDKFKKCEKIYFPYLKKYLIMQDDCVQCDKDAKNGITHIDVWTSITGKCVNGGQDQIKCENSLTPDAKQQVVRNPASDLPVDTTDLWTGSKCNTGHVFPGAKISC